MTSKASLNYALKNDKANFISYNSVHSYAEVDEGDKKLDTPTSNGAAVLVQKTVISYTSSASPISSALQSGNGNYTDIVIQNFEGILKKMWLQFGITISVDTVTLTPTPLWIQRVEFLGNGGSLLIQQLWGDVLYNNLNMLTSEQLSGQLGKVNMSAGFTAAAAVATGTWVYTLPLIGAFCEQSKILMSALNGTITCRVYWVNPGNAVIAGAGTCALNSVTLFCEYDVLSDEDFKELSARYKGGVSPSNPNMVYTGNLELPILTSNNMSITQTLTASTTWNQDLTAFQGLIMGCFFFIRASKSNGTGYMTLADPTDLTTFQINDSNSLPILSQQPLSFNTLQALIYDLFPGVLYANRDIVPIVHDDNPYMAITKGVKDKFICYTGQEKLYVNFSSTFSTGSYTFDIYFYSWQHMEIRQGQIYIISP